MEPNWMARGLCADQPPETFFPSDGVGVEIAKRICGKCPVQEPCLEYALTNRIDAVAVDTTAGSRTNRVKRS